MIIIQARKSNSLKLTQPLLNVYCETPTTPEAVVFNPSNQQKVVYSVVSVLKGFQVTVRDWLNHSVKNKYTVWVYIQLNLHKDPLARLGFNHKFITMVGLYAK